MMHFETEQARNRRRTAVLLAAMFVLTCAASVMVSWYLGLGSVLVVPVAVGVAVLSVWVSYWHSDKIVLTMTRARVVDFDTAPQLHNLVEEVCIAGGIPKPLIAIVEDPAPNAFATGRNPEHGLVAFTTGLLRTMDRDELQGVAAHELAHITNRDTLVMTVAATTAGIVAILADLSWRVAFFSGGQRRRDTHPLLLIIGVVGVLLAPLAAMLLKSAVSRSRETLADATAVALTRNPAGLRRALEKLRDDTTVVETRSTAMSHLWIESPLDGRSRKMFSTHPPIQERIDRLRLMEGERSPVPTP